MATVQPRLMTAEEFSEWLDRPENRDRFFELERGEVREMPTPSEYHGVICSFIAHLLWEYVFRRGGKGLVSSNDAGLLVERNPDTVRGPDVMFWEETRQADELSRKFSTQLPRLIVEVLSPSDTVTRTNRRVSQYLRRGVPLVWLVDPEVRSVTVYRPGQDYTVLDETDELVVEEVLPGWRCRVADLFAVPGWPK
jgi:Uma2 family endonuclease